MKEQDVVAVGCKLQTNLSSLLEKLRHRSCTGYQASEELLSGKLGIFQTLLLKGCQEAALLLFLLHLSANLFHSLQKLISGNRLYQIIGDADTDAFLGILEFIVAAQNKNLHIRHFLLYQAA